MSEVMDRFVPLQRIKCCTSDKPWMTSKLKTLISRRQKSFVSHGKILLLLNIGETRFSRNARRAERNSMKGKSVP